MPPRGAGRGPAGGEPSAAGLRGRGSGGGGLPRCEVAAPGAPSVGSPPEHPGDGAEWGRPLSAAAARAPVSVRAGSWPTSSTRPRRFPSGRQAGTPPRLYGSPPTAPAAAPSRARPLGAAVEERPGESGAGRGAPPRVPTRLGQPGWCLPAAGGPDPADFGKRRRGRRAGGDEGRVGAGVAAGRRRPCRAAAGAPRRGERLRGAPQPPQRPVLHGISPKAAS